MINITKNILLLITLIIHNQGYAQDRHDESTIDLIKDFYDAAGNQNDGQFFGTKLLYFNGSAEFNDI
ncbi:MAG: hypothetical protein CMP10_20065, partial [Zetaproteobacteria bacterium]|nr:hypothetical protein [Pseudobdellovibrionaceae bacterium]